jgi:UDP-N-acetyl-2-amino-2-deoxyglucuronate dehydrogenase
MRAIKDTGNHLVAAMDRNDSVGVLDRFFPETHFFTEIERVDRFLDKRRRGGDDNRIEYISICSPNYLHDAHIRMALRSGCDVICEKPLVINPWNLDALEEIEAETGQRVNTVLQLRLHPTIVQLREKLGAMSGRHEINLSYVTYRGPWYNVSWKGDEAKSGGVAMNIGIHFFDLVLWLFGEAHESRVHLREERRMAGVLELERARVRWFLSVETSDLPPGHLKAGKTAHRSLTLNGEEIEFTEGFTDLHAQVYQRTLTGDGFGILAARPSIDLVYDIRTQEPVKPKDDAHPILTGGEPIRGGGQ